MRIFHDCGLVHDFYVILGDDNFHTTAGDFQNFSEIKEDSNGSFMIAGFVKDFAAIVEDDGNFSLIMGNDHNVVTVKLASELWFLKVISFSLRQKGAGSCIIHISKFSYNLNNCLGQCLPTSGMCNMSDIQMQRR